MATTLLGPLSVWDYFRICTLPLAKGSSCQAGLKKSGANTQDGGGRGPPSCIPGSVGDAVAQMACLIQA